MSKVKYAPLVTHIVNEHQGFTFQTARSGNVMMKAQANDRARQLRRQNRQVNLINPAGHWRTLSAPQQAAWNLFAATYPQQSKRNPLVFLTGYQLFLKRNQYCHLNYDIKNGFIFEPILAELPALSIVPTINQTQNVLDVTEPYIKQFGIIPAPGQWLLFKAVPMAVHSGQFYETIYLQLQVLESYIDGLFISLELSANMPEVVFSVFLSKPYSQSVTYSGTKTRYMGCFTSKTFLELTDTPASYEGEAGKTVTVKADESGLEFTTPAGGGLTCETLPECPVIIGLNETDANLQQQINDLPAGGLTCETLAACPTIVQILEQIINIGTEVILINDQSIPKIRNGILYNAYVIESEKNLGNSGFDLFYYDMDYLTWLNNFGGFAASALKIKSLEAEFWNLFNLHTNTSLLNFRGNGQRTYVGDFTLIKTQFSWYLKRLNQTAYRIFSNQNANTYTSQAVTALTKTNGLGTRLYKAAVGIPNGTQGVYVGNNGRMYRTVVWYDREILADNLCETKFSDGTEIPEITDTAQWAATITPARCNYNNLVSNV